MMKQIKKMSVWFNIKGNVYDLLSYKLLGKPFLYSKQSIVFIYHMHTQIFINVIIFVRWEMWSFLMLFIHCLILKSTLLSHFNLSHRMKHTFWLSLHSLISLFSYLFTGSNVNNVLCVKWKDRCEWKNVDSLRKERMFKGY